MEKNAAHEEWSRFAKDKITAVNIPKITLRDHLLPEKRSKNVGEKKQNSKRGAVTTC
jgi:hypothetical protein